MSIILKEEASNSIPAPSSGKTTLFVDDNGVLSIKNDGNTTTTFPTLATSNTQVLFTDGTAIGGDNDFVYDKNTNILTLTGNLAAGNVKTDNLLYANGVPWDLQDPGGSNTQIQFNDDESFGGSAAFTFNKTNNLVSVGNNLSVVGNANIGNIGTTQVLATANITALQLISNISTGTAPLVITSTTKVTNLNADLLDGYDTATAATANTVVVRNEDGNITGNNIAGTLTTASQTNITSVGTLGSLAVTANITAGNVYANSGTIGASLVAGTLTTAAQPNITSVGTLSSLTVSGNVAAGNLNATSAVIASTLTSNVATGTAPFTVSSTTKVANLNADTVDGYDTATAATANTIAVRDADGNLTANFFIGNGSQLTGLLTSSISNGNSNVSIPSANGNVNISAVGNANVLVVTGTGANITGTFNATGTATVGGNLNVTGNAIITGNLTVDGNLVYVNVDTLAVEDPIIQLQSGPNGAAPASNSGKDVGTALNYYDSEARVAFMGWDVSNTEFGLASVSTITNEVVTFTTYGNLRIGNIIGNGQALTGLTGANVTGQVGNALVAGTVYTAAQPNITSVGTLSSLTVTANADANNLNATNKVVASTLTSNVATGTAPLTVSSTTKVANLNADTVDGYDSATAATANTIAIRDADGNLTANFFIGNGSQLTGLSTSSISNGNSNVSIPAANGNVTISAVGNANVLVVTGTGSNITGTLNVTGNLTVDTTTLVVNSTNNIVGIGAAPSVNNTPALLVASAFAAPSGISPYNGLYVRSTDAVAADKGGVISLGGEWMTGQEDTRWAAIAGLKEDSTSGNYGGYLSFYSRAMGGAVSERMRIAPSGNVGIANTAPTHTLSVTGTMNVSGNANVGNIGGAAGVFTTVAGSLTTAAQPNITSIGTLTSLTATGNITAGNANVSGQLISTVATGTAPIVISSTTKVANLNADTLDGYDSATAATANTVVVRNADGNITANNISGTLSTAAQTNITSVGSLGSTQISSLGVGTAASGTTGEIRATNNVTAYYSDKRLKDFHGTIPNAVEKIMQLNGYYFTENELAKSLGYNNDKMQVGVSAQEVEIVMPEVVTDAPIDNKYKTIYYEKLVPLLIEGIKEQQATIQDLQKQINNLKEINK